MSLVVALPGFDKETGLSKKICLIISQGIMRWPNALLEQVRRDLKLLTRRQDYNKNDSKKIFQNDNNWSSSVIYNKK